MRHDAIVVGAGPAGCAAAYDLAAAGRHVLLLDHRRFPRLKPCAGGITIRTQRALRYPIAPVVRQVCTDIGMGRRLEAATTFHSRHPLCAMTVRQEFDDWCLRRTIERGAEFRVIGRVEAITEAADEVVLETGDGTFRAPWLIGADGANGVVRRLLPGHTSPVRGFAIEAQVPGDTPPSMQFDFGIVEFGYGWLFPKRDHVNVGLYTNSPALRPGRDELAAYARARLGDVELHHVVGHHVALRGWEHALATRRVMLAGDAAGLVDPLLGEGIANAVASGQAAAAAIAEACRGGHDVRSLYARALRPIVQSLRTAWRDAARFYRNIDFGYRVLTAAPVRAAVIAGYARGMTHGSLKRWFFLTPLLPGRRG